MSRYPCPTPTICGVTYHHDPSNCRGSLSSRTASSLPVPSSVTVSSSHPQDDRAVFEAIGGEVTEDYWPNGLKRTEEWILDGEFHRSQGPAFQQWNESGQKIMEEWFKEGEYFRTDGPSFQVWYDNGQLQTAKWILDTVTSHLGSPSIEYWHENGQKMIETWTVNGERHRVDGPSFREWYPSGVLKEERWQVNNQFHRDDGPAYILQDENGEITKQEFFLEGTLITDIDYFCASALPYFRRSHSEFDDMPDEWVIEYLKGQLT